LERQSRSEVLRPLLLLPVDGARARVVQGLDAQRSERQAAQLARGAHAGHHQAAAAGRRVGERPERGVLGGFAGPRDRAGVERAERLPALRMLFALLPALVLGAAFVPSGDGPSAAAARLAAPFLAGLGLFPAAFAGAARRGFALAGVIVGATLCGEILARLLS